MDATRSPRFNASLGNRLALAVVGVLVVSSALLLFELTTRERASVLQSKETAAAIVADLFAASVATPLDFQDIPAIEGEIVSFARSFEVQCAAVWNASDSKPIAAFHNERCAELIGPKAEELGKTMMFSDRVEVARQVVGPQGPLGRTLVVFSLKGENAAFEASRSRLFWLFFLLTAGTAALLLTAVRFWVISPVMQLGAAARRVGMGDFRAKVTLRATDEIGQLGQAFNAMGEAIADREEQLEAATRSLRELFDHMQQAILAFGRDGKVVGEVSHQALNVFGIEDLVGRDVRDLLYPDRHPHDVDAQAFDEWLKLAFDLAEDQWPSLEDLAPKEVMVEGRGGKKFIIETEFRPVSQHGKLEKVMLLATDVTETRKLERAVRSQEEEHARRMALMRRLVAGGGQVFVTFVDGARERIDRCDAIVSGGGDGGLLKSEIDELFRHIHTVKGESRAFDMRELEHEAAVLEEKLSVLRDRVRGGVLKTVSADTGLTAHLGRIRRGIDQASEIFVAASPIGRAALDQITVLRTDVDELAAWVSSNALTRSPANLAGIAARLAARPFGECTLPLVEGAPTWAAGEGKLVHVVVDGRECAIPPKLARVLPAALTHLVRNAVAHGIEARDVRKSLGKEPHGVVRLSAAPGPEGPLITVEDDGAGLDGAKIAEAALRLGLTAKGPGEVIFHAGFTTAIAGELSGRGVGLGAVRDDLAAVGYAIEISSTEGKRTRVTLKPAKAS